MVARRRYLVMLCRCFECTVIWCMERFKAPWLGILHFIGTIHFTVSHALVFLDGNTVADAMANSNMEEAVWFSSIPWIDILVDRTFMVVIIFCTLGGYSFFPIFFFFLLDFNEIRIFWFPVLMDYKTLGFIFCFVFNKTSYLI